MKLKFPGSLVRVVAVFLISLCLVAVTWSQADPDPNSPSPVLLGFSDTVRRPILPKRPLSRKQAILIDEPPQLDSDLEGEAESKLNVYISSVPLSSGEDFSAFRVYARDPDGRLYRFPTLSLQAADFSKDVYVLTVSTKDELNYWDPPSSNRDLSIQVSWRGMGSNELPLSDRKLGIPFVQSQLANPKQSTTVGVPNSSGPSLKLVGYKWSGDRMRFLEQATFGPTAAMDFRIRRIGLHVWLEEQFDAPYPSLNNPYPNQPLKPSSAPSDCDGDPTVPDVPATCFRDTYTMYQPQTWFLREAFSGDAQLRHRVAWALSQIWVTSGVDIQQGRHMVEYDKILARNAFGNYRTLMKEMTLAATMGDYLDMARSTKNNPNENYARELMQLFTVGLFLLNPDGTKQLDASNNAIPTYDQNNVNNLTKVLTGWSFCQTAASCPSLTPGTVNFIDPLLLSTGNHDVTAKTLLSYPGSTTSNIAACTGCNSTAITTYANNSLDQALDNIYNHPNVGPFVSKTLIQHLVTSDPTPAYVGRVTAVFNANRANPTQLKEVVKAILLDPEARGDVKTDPNFGKLREPVQLATNFLRTFSVRSADGLGLSDGNIVGRSEFNGMGQSPFRSPTVFNYYPPDYVVPNSSLLGPEFALMTTGTAIQRANFMNRFVFTSVPVAVALPDSPNGTAVDFSDLQALVAGDTSNNQLLDALNQRMLHGTMSSAMRSTIMTALNSITVSNPPTAAQTLSRVRQAVYLVATSSQYQVQR